MTLSDASFFSVPRNSLTFISALNSTPQPLTAILGVRVAQSFYDVMTKNRMRLYIKGLPGRTEDDLQSDGIDLVLNVPCLVTFNCGDGRTGDHARL